MPDVITFKFKPCAIGIAEICQNGFDIGKGIFENEITTVFEKFRFPVMLPVAAPGKGGEQAEIHRPHIQ